MALAAVLRIRGRGYSSEGLHGVGDPLATMAATCHFNGAGQSSEERKADEGPLTASNGKRELEGKVASLTAQYWLRRRGKVVTKGAEFQEHFVECVNANIPEAGPVHLK